MLDLNFYLSEMVLEDFYYRNPEGQPNNVEVRRTMFKDVPADSYHIFKKKPWLSIKDMQSKTKHLVRNKLSDKLSRRDVHYYDLYALREPAEEYEIAMREGYPISQADTKI